MSSVSTRSRRGAPAPAAPSTTSSSALAPPPPQQQQQQHPEQLDHHQYNLDDNPHKLDPIPAIGRHVRASSDPISRGGAFNLDNENGAHLDQEPNPFEQSFRPGPVDATGGAVAGPSGQGRRARSVSPYQPRPTPGGSKLASYSMIQTPGTELANFGWGQDPLRTGGLSPAILAAANHGSLYDTSLLRTGLTPYTSAGVATGSVSFPPPSPATAALFAMMTNNTPGTADPALAGGGPRPHEGPNEGNHFEASFGRAADTKVDVSAHSAPPVHNFPPSVAGGGHRAALANHNLNGRSMTPRGMHPSAPPPPPQGYYGHQQPVYSQSPPQPYPPQYSQAPPAHVPQPGQFANHNPLYLLSQASSHGVTGVTDDAVVAAAALSGLATPGGQYGHGQTMESLQQNGVIPASMGVPAVAPTLGGGPASGTRGQSPATSAAGKTTGRNKAPAATAANNKRKKADTEDKKPPAKKGRRAAAKQVEEDDDDDDDEGGEGESLSPQPHNPNETEDEKRKNFLERNRQAALKCRQRKKAWLANLQTKVEFLTTDNDTLQSTVTNLKEEIQSLRAILQAHANCPVASNPVADRRSAVPAGYSNGQRY